MLRAATATALLLAAPFLASSASAAIATTIDSSGSLEVEALPGSPGGFTRTYSGNAADTIISPFPSSALPKFGVSIYTVGSVEPPMGNTQFYLFSNVVSDAGASQVEAVTILRQAITNDSATARTAAWTSELLNGGLSVNWDNATPTAGRSLQAGFDIQIALEGVSKYAASGQLDQDSATFSDSALAFSNFRSIAPTGSGEGQLYVWDRTPLTLDLGLFDAGETRVLTYVVRTLVDVDQFCEAQSIDLCASAFAGIGDPPRSGGGVIMSGLFAHFSFQTPLNLEPLRATVTFSAVQVPEPAALGLLTLGLSIVANRRRRTA